MFGKQTKWALALGCAFALLPVGCGDDEDTGAANLAQRGESCHSRLDCAAGLACLGNTCTIADFVYNPTGKECVAIQCREPVDCCPEPPAYCPNYQDLCNQGSTAYCDAYALECVCGAADWNCENDACIPRCDTVANPCVTGTCVNSRCVECAGDSDCLTTQVCQDQVCVDKCQETVDCPYFHECEAGLCVEVGCSDNRECVAELANVLAVCNADRECQIPCQTDSECQVEGYAFMACVNQVCENIGCETDDECRLQLNLPAGTDAACREPTNL